VAASTATVTATKTATCGAAETAAVHPAGKATAAMKTAAETGLAAAGKVVGPTAMVESAERAGVAVRCHVRRSKAAGFPMVKPRPATMKIMKSLTVKFTAVKAVKVVTMKITAVGEAVAMVKKDMAMGNKPSVIKNNKTTAQVQPQKAQPPR